MTKESSIKVRISLLAAVRHILVPIARILIRNGVTHEDFDKVAKHAFVTAGVSVLKEKKLPVTKARLSLTTWLPQGEVERIMKGSQQIAPLRPSTGYTAAAVLNAWHTKPPFVVPPYGIPMDLVYEADDTKATFVELVRMCDPSADPSEILAELTSSGAVTQDDRGFLHATSRAYVAADLSQEQIEYMARAARRFLDTLDVNLTERGRETGRFERSVYADHGIPHGRYEEFVSFIRATMQKTLVEIDEWITINAPPGSSDNVHWTGVGMYHWMERPEDFELRFSDMDGTQSQSVVTD